jgi:hypothetical protein
MSALPDYDVIVWINYNEFGKKLEKDLLLVVDIEPYDRNEYDGILDMHWGFETWEDALKFSNIVNKYVNNPNVIYLKTSNIKNPDVSMVYKDERYKKSN